MKKISFCFIFLLLFSSTLYSQVGINTDGSNPDPSSGLDVNFTNKGVLIPRLTFEQRNAITTPANGLMVFCMDCGTNGALCLYSGGAWRTFSPCNSNAPIAGTHIALPTQITWNWSESPEAAGYKWNTVNNYSASTDIGLITTKTETGLTCNTSYTRYLWAYYSCGTSSATTLIKSTLSFPSPPVAGTHVPSSAQIIWNWNATAGAAGYKWCATNNYATATEMGTSTTKTETGLNCNTPYTRYVWAYNVCGNSASSTLTQITLSNPDPPAEGSHVPSLNMIVWKWNAVPGATGYRWNTTNDYNAATDMGTSLLIMESGLACNMAYTRYVWTYNTCGNSVATALNQSTLTNPPAAPIAGTHVPSPTQIVWNWNPVTGATGYRWNTTNDYSSATDLGAVTTKTETDLVCNTPYTRYVWAYSACGVSTPVALIQTTSPCAVLPTVSTTAISNIDYNTSTGGGNVTSDGGAPVTARGVCWSTSTNPTTAGSHTTDGSGTGEFISNITGLTLNTLYYVRAYATNIAGTSYGNQQSFTTLSFAIGQSYGGGIIFYIDGTGQHGLIVAASDQSSGTWGCYGTTIGGTSTAIGTGQANTTAIVNGCGTTGIAARICNDLSLNGYDDWFLPSKDELNQLCLQESVVGGFATSTYWSSSEYDADSAWEQYFGSGTQDGYPKNYGDYVRAVRAF